MMLPTLTTARLVLRPATDEDLEALWRLLTDPDVRRYLCDDRVLTRAEVRTLLAESCAQWPRMGLWLLNEPAERCVGAIALHPVLSDILTHAPHLAGEIEPSIALAPEHWGRGYAAEALRAAFAHAFATLGLERLVAVVDEPNERSHRLMRRVGFTLTGTTPTGPCYPLRTYRLTRSAFAAASGRPP